ncbi:uncharacterized protein LOC106154348 [Lingula anatina]|uniref:Uncharacterized protein LOC106154348 n=1 Tax=Lingula anatina TaxID=7574 RepID=A0A1S3HDN2_LINAN|nr:uncharacterized protein LOC106154348 [Lingula anatina]|eukprot:XP_013384130.1 uncharacterized protein LOC106154348 [Lingula anatina]
MTNLKYPVPTLESTLSELTRVMDQLLDKERFDDFQSRLRALQDDGTWEKIQLAFTEAVKDKDNWATEGFHKNLLSLRYPIPSSTVITALLEDDEKHSDQLRRAATLLHATACVKAKPELLTNCIGMERGEQLETSQAHYMLSSCRVPGLEMDTLATFTDSQHVVVLQKGAAFKVDVIQPNGQPVSLEKIYRQLQAVTRHDGAPPSIAPFSALDRPTWAGIRESLIQRGASDAIHVMESAILALSLEEKSAPDTRSKILEATRLGNDTQQCYYDKVINLVVYKDGKTGMLVEHTSVDAVVPGALVYLLTYLPKNLSFDENLDPVISSIPACPLDFHISTQDQKKIQTNIPTNGSDRIVSELDIPMLPDIMNLIREQRLIDIWMNLSTQLALQLTKNTLKILMVEPTHVRRFIEGRSDPTMPVTDQSRTFIDSLIAKEPHGVLFQKFAAATQMHKNLIRETKQGKAFGPHIAALRNILLTAANVDATLISYLKIFQVPEVYFTGNDGVKGLVTSVANVYAPNQICVAYHAKPDKIAFQIAAKGFYQCHISSFLETLRQSIDAVMQIVVPFSLAKQMGALESLQMSSKSERPFSIVLHAGAGENFKQDNKAKKLIEFAMQAALSVGSKMLAEGKPSLEAVQATVVSLENCFLFNAGKGAVLNASGEHELEACIMDGKTGKCGAAACLKSVKNPVEAARLVCDKTKHVLLIGEKAETLCRENGLATVPNKYFKTFMREQQFRQVASSASNNNDPQTVGAVAVDVYGNLAVATSTGGVLNKMEGRVGDTGIPGAGCFADEKVAVACSGDGEAFLRNAIAHDVAKLVDYKKLSIKEACKYSLEKNLQNHKGGIVAIDKDGTIAVEFNSSVMFVASMEKNGAIASEVMMKGSGPSPMPRDHLKIKDGKRCNVHLHEYPSTPGVTLITSNSTKMGVDLFQMPLQDYEDLMMEVHGIVPFLQKKLKVQRCAMVSAPSPMLPAHMKLVPLHGLGQVWEPVTSADEEYNEEYPGYVSSKNGPRLSNQELDRIKKSITSLSALQNVNNVFHGESSDNNLFARIVRNEEEHWRVWEDEDHIAFLTPFPNTPGFTVLAPRRHLSSDIFNLENEDYRKLVIAGYKVANLLKKSLGALHCAMIFEGCEIDYAHVKLIPVFATDSTTSKTRKNSKAEYSKTYLGFVSSADGPKADDNELKSLHSFLTTDSIAAPKSWEDPETHSIAAIRSTWYQNVFQVQNTLFHATVDYFNQRCKYNYALTPLTTDCISSPMGLGSDSEPVEIDLFGQKIFLADSMQFTLEYFLRFQDGLQGTYYISPSFRGEDPDATHLNQFYHIECELLGKLDDAISLAEGYIYHLTKSMLKSHRQFILATAGTTEHAEQLVEIMKGGKSLPRVTVDQAIAMFPIDDCYEDVVPGKPEMGKKVTRKGEHFLIDKYGGAIWLTEMDHLGVPFYQCYTDDTRKKALAADLLIGLGETLGLGERHATATEVEQALDHHAVPHSSYKWYIDMRTEKPMKTSGWGMGSERYLCWLLNHDDVRDLHVIPRFKGKKYLP